MAVKFNYPPEYKNLPEYTKHAGQLVTVIRQLTDDECDPECGPMYRIRASDGWEGSAHLDELEFIAD